MNGGFTDYTYQVMVRVDNDTGATDAFITSAGGDIGKASTHFDIFIEGKRFGNKIGDIIVQSVRSDLDKGDQA